jgi:hypothetical protein
LLDHFSDATHFSEAQQVNGPLEEKWNVSSFLALGTVVGTTLSHHTPYDRRSTALARLSFSSVDVSLILVRTVLAVRRHIVADTGPTGFNGALQDLANCIREPLGFSPGDSRRTTTGADAGQKEGFIRIDVSDTGHHGLIEQECLDGGLPLSTGCKKVLAGDLQCIQAQSLQSGMHFISGKEEQLPEFPNVTEIDIGPFVIKREHHVGVWIRLETKLLLGRKRRTGRGGKKTRTRGHG